MYAAPMAAGGYGGVPMMYGAPGMPMAGMPMGMMQPMQPGMPMAPMMPMMQPGTYAPSWMPAQHPMQAGVMMAPPPQGVPPPQQYMQQAPPSQQQQQQGYGPMRHDRRPQVKPNPY